ncbi:hypothetical protein [Cupriavidus sp. UYPR2.512]|uniref:hypothetical protein n=1 Tax=Cupriavidus sp. UYPR2.512 TaxID=1080187 RepID=UPI00035F50D8|nr:hypothetical protein [Cupriavidus sp. UYPR2.512]UIF87369.1 hypothetical protein KAF44_07535 [Cupriavidus necator]
MKVNRTRHGLPQHGIAGACIVLALAVLALCIPAGTVQAQSAGMGNLLKRHPSTQASDPGNSQREARARAERHRAEQRDAERRRGDERGGSRLSPDERRKLRKNLYDFGRDIYQGG